MPGARPAARAASSGKTASSGEPASSGATGSWGWHRLEPDWARRLVAGSGLMPGRLVYDLGAGHGVISAELLAAGAEVVAVERHPGRAARLRARFRAEIADGRIRVLEVDLRELRLPRRPFRVVANPPFALTSPLLALLTGRHSSLVRADLVLQRAVVRRWDASTGSGTRHHGLGRGFVGRDRGQVPRSAFRPRPPVDTAILQIQRIRQLGSRP